MSIVVMLHSKMNFLLPAWLYRVLSCCYGVCTQMCAQQFDFFFPVYFMNFHELFIFRRETHQARHHTIPSQFLAMRYPDYLLITSLPVLSSNTKIKLSHFTCVFCLQNEVAKHNNTEIKPPINVTLMPSQSANHFDIN